MAHWKRGEEPRAAAQPEPRALASVEKDWFFWRVVTYPTFDEDDIRPARPASGVSMLGGQLLDCIPIIPKFRSTQRQANEIFDEVIQDEDAPQGMVIVGRAEQGGYADSRVMFSIEDPLDVLRSLHVATSSRLHERGIALEMQASVPARGHMEPHITVSGPDVLRSGLDLWVGSLTLMRIEGDGSSTSVTPVREAELQEFKGYEQAPA